MSEETSATTGGTTAAADATATATQTQGAQVQTAAADAKATQASVVPAKYELKPVEGYTHSTELFEKFARAQGLDNAKAQEFLSFQASHAAALESARSEAWEAKQSDWAKQIAEDKELGGANLAVTKANVDRVFSKVSPEVEAEVRELFQASGLGNHPGFVRLFNALGKHMDGESINTGGSGAAPQDPARIMFPDMK